MERRRVACDCTLVVFHSVRRANGGEAGTRPCRRDASLTSRYLVRGDKIGRATMRLDLGLLESDDFRRTNCAAMPERFSPAGGVASIPESRADKDQNFLTNPFRDVELSSQERSGIRGPAATIREFHKFTTNTRLYNNLTG